MIDIIVPVYNNLRYTKLFLLSLSKQSFKNFKIIIIDNWSNDGTLEFMEETSKILPIKVITNKENLWYVKAINMWLATSKEQYILLWNNDTILPSNLLNKLINCIWDYGIISAYSNQKDESSKSELLIKYEGKPILKDINLFAKKLDFEFKDEMRDVEAVFWHCLFMKRDVVNEVWLLDERFWIWNYDDIDFCRRSKEKWFKIWLAKWAFIYHFCHATFDYLWIDIEDILKENFSIYKEKWQ